MEFPARTLLVIILLVAFRLRNRAAQHSDRAIIEEIEHETIARGRIVETIIPLSQINIHGHMPVYWARKGSIHCINATKCYRLLLSRCGTLPRLLRLLTCRGRYDRRGFS